MYLIFKKLVLLNNVYRAEALQYNALLTTKHYIIAVILNKQQSAT